LAGVKLISSAKWGPAHPTSDQLICQLPTKAEKKGENSLGAALICGWVYLHSAVQLSLQFVECFANSSVLFTGVLFAVAALVEIIMQMPQGSGNVLLNCELTILPVEIAFH